MHHSRPRLSSLRALAADTVRPRRHPHRSDRPWSGCAPRYPRPAVHPRVHERLPRRVHRQRLPQRGLPAAGHARSAQRTQLLLSVHQGHQRAPVSRRRRPVVDHIHHEQLHQPARFTLQRGRFRTRLHSEFDKSPGLRRTRQGRPPHRGLLRLRAQGRRLGAAAKVTCRHSSQLPGREGTLPHRVAEISWPHRGPRA